MAVTEAEIQYMTRAVAEIREKIAAAAKQAGRSPADIKLCAACKTRTPETVLESARLPIDLFGENHVQELVRNADAGAYLGKPAHLIGHLQTNKIKKVLGRACLIQSVDSLHLLQAIEKEAARLDLVQDILIEVNIGDEASKTGLPESELPVLLEAAAASEHLRVKGLMAIPPADQSDEENRRCFARMRELSFAAAQRHLEHVTMEELSMGMSGDFENAVREGATIVRIGTAIYGARDYSHKA